MSVASGGNAGPDATWKRLERARARSRGEHQLSEYVSELSPAELAEILAASPRGLPLLASHHAECRVQAGEERDFVEVMRVWALYTLSGLEGG